MKNPIFYKFQEIQNEVCVIAQTNELNPYNIERILGVVKNVRINNRKSKFDFEKVEIKSQYYPSDDGIYLIKRKDLISHNIMSKFIGSYWNGTRTEDSHPYWKDLLDESLIADMNCTVLTYKHWFSSSDPNRISKCFSLVKNEDVEEVAREFKLSDEKVEEDFKRIQTLRKNQQEKKVNWFSV